MFSKKKFLNPDAVNYPGYFWFWNAPLDKKKMFSQLEEMCRLGAYTVCPHPLPHDFRERMMTDMKPDYLTPEYFRLYRDIADKCSELGMNSYLYDEGGWPSGGACGRVLASNPKKFRRRMLKLDKHGEVKIVGEPRWKGKALLPDLLNPAAVEKFLELTHQAYARSIGKYLGNTVRFAFLDEPELGCLLLGGLPWTGNMAEEFQKRKHYDIRPFLKEILQNGDDIPAETVRKRLDYYDVCSRLFVERYLLPVRDWCRKHKMLSGGHFGSEDEWFPHWFLTGLQGFGSILRSLRALDAPGVDVIWRQIYPGSRIHPFPKLASSAAAQTGNRYVLGEVFGVYGSGLSFDTMKFIVDFMLVCGVNTFVICALPYATRGGLMEGERPHFGPINPLWEYTPEFHRRTARLSAAFTSAKPEVTTALFYDIRSRWTGGRTAEYSAVNQLEAANALLNAQCDFDYVDDDVLAEGKLKDGRFSYGKTSYERLVLPSNPRFSPEAEAGLQRLMKAGFPVLNADRADEVPPVLDVFPATGRLRVRKMISRNGEALYFVLNISSTEVKAEFKAAEQAPVARCDANDGNLYLVDAKSKGKWSWTFAPYDSALFLVGPQAKQVLPASAVPDVPVLTLNGPWKFRPLRQISVGPNDYEARQLEKGFRSIKLGDWQPVLGSDFSGEVLYRLDFDWDGKGEPEFLNLGKVRFCAKVFLNGLELGTRIFTPFIFSLQGALKPGKNRLEVYVANTLANAITPKEVANKWFREFPAVCAYEVRQRDYEVESLDSGLFGPVELYSATQHKD